MGNYLYQGDTQKLHKQHTYMRDKTLTAPYMFIKVKYFDCA